jgi:hypothetical protein
LPWASSATAPLGETNDWIPTTTGKTPSISSQMPMD